MGKFNPKFVQNIIEEIIFCERYLDGTYSPNPVGGINLRKIEERLRVFEAKLEKIKKKFPENFEHLVPGVQMDEFLKKFLLLHSLH